MSETDNKMPGAFYYRAASYSILMPLAAVGVWFAFFWVMRFWPGIDRFFVWVFRSLFFLLLSSFALGVTSLFGIRRYGTEAILGKALAGIVLSLLFAVVAFFFCLAASIRC